MNCLRRLSLFVALVLVVTSSVAVAVAEEPRQPVSETDNTDEESLTESERALLDAASEIAEQVAEIRGLPLKSSIPKGVKNREQLREMLVEQFHEELSEEQFRAEADVYRRMGLFAEELDYRELMLDLMTEQIAGFYDQHEGELYLMQGLPESLQRSTMAHELFHAIQDQHFGINELLAPFDAHEHADYSLARMALIEGDATVLMADYELYEQGVLPQNRRRSLIDIPQIAAAILELDPMEMAAAEQLEQPDAMDLGAETVPSMTDSALGNAPPIVRDPLLFPYIEGMRFVVRARSGRTWEEFDEIYEQAPVSTSQILHPELFFDGVEPLDVTFEADDALPDYRQVYETVFGELKTRSWMTTHLDDVSESLPAAEELARGWRGDRIKGYVGPDDEMLVTHLSTWDTVEDAEDFARALDAMLRTRHDAQSAHRTGEHGEAWCIRPGTAARGERHYVERWGNLVLYLEGAPSLLDAEGRETDATAYMVRDAVWNSHRRDPFEEVLERRRAEEQKDQSNRDDSDQNESRGTENQDSKTSETDPANQLAGPLLDCAA